MKSIVVRLVIAVVLVAALALGTEILRIRGGATKPVALPTTKLDALPMELGSWKGETTELDPKLFRVIGAEDVLSRAYKNPAGRTMTLHVAVFGDYTRGLPHSPMICYPSAGWTVMDRKDVPLKSAGDSTVNVRAVTFDLEGQRVQLMFWYQFADRVIIDEAGLEEARRALRGRKTWPAMIKVLLQSPVANPEQTESQLTDFATQVYAWTSQIQPPETESAPIATDETASPETSEAK